ncbi:riboflavin synthase subunit alpha [Synergistales bacterium]|nr:riboflavin synthase subunit alpha [Synergistales bacterium]
MFTGLIEALGTVRHIGKSGSVVRLALECPEIASELTVGQSVAVSGVCLTVTSLRGMVFEVEMMPETVERTRFVELKTGERLNLERAMKLDGRLDGHIVQGHIDGVATLMDLSGSATKRARFSIDRSAGRFIVSKGSVAIDGVSLTVIDIEDDNERSSFSVGLISETLKNCTLGQIKAGDRVNVETDIIGRYVERLLTVQNKDGKKTDSLTIDKLRNLGF